ncbi:MAG: hypothetical protein H6Q71_1157, partial [Firmicutes bacterium]|nr:hypothetical protein [Bacillota bacterium]
LCDCDNLAPARAHFFKLYDMMVVREKEKVLNENVAALVAESKISYLA